MENHMGADAVFKIFNLENCCRSSSRSDHFTPAENHALFHLWSTTLFENQMGSEHREYKGIVSFFF